MKNERLKLTCKYGETFLPELINNWTKWADSYGGMLDHAIKTRNELFPGHTSITEVLMISESLYSTVNIYPDERVVVSHKPAGMEEFDFWMLYTVAKLCCPMAVMQSNINKQLIVDYAKWLLENTVLKWSPSDMAEKNGLGLVRYMWRRNTNTRPLYGKTFSTILNTVLAMNGVKGLDILDRPVSAFSKGARPFRVPVEMFEDMYLELIGTNYMDTLTDILYRYTNDIIRLSNPDADGFYNSDYLVRNNAIRLR